MVLVHAVRFSEVTGLFVSGRSWRRSAGRGSVWGLVINRSNFPLCCRETAADTRTIPDPLYEKFNKTDSLDAYRNTEKERGSNPKTRAHLPIQPRNTAPFLVRWTAAGAEDGACWSS